MKKINLIILFSLLLSLWVPGALAAEEAEASNSNGYIVKLQEAIQPQAKLMEAESGVTPLYPEQSLYHCEDTAGLLTLLDAGVVDYFEPDAVVTLQAVPNDPYYAQQWNLEMTGIEAAWDEGLNGDGVRVAVVDSGLNTGHEDLAGISIETGYSLIDENTDVTDYTGHGTFVSGILAAAANNGKGIAGAVDAVTLIPLKCFANSMETYVSYILPAIYMAIDDYDCDVLNLSFGTTDDLRLMREAIDYAEESGVLVIAAVGNYGDSFYLYPAAYENVIGVGSIGQRGTVSSFSQKNASVDVTAPGEYIYSLDNESTSGYSSNSGTSFATPLVAAMAVMAKQHDPSITVAEFKQLLIATVDDAGTAGYDVQYGHGIVNIPAFVEQLLSDEPIVVPPEFTDIENHWAKTYIEYCVSEGLFQGTSDTTFEPDVNMNRGMFVTVLSRLNGADVSDYTADFSDVFPGDWYYGSVGWGVENGIVAGISDTEFGPLQSVTREQLAVFFYRYATLLGDSDGAYSPDALQGYTDTGNISGWALEAVNWTVDHGLIIGRTATTLEPQGTATRAEVATILMRFEQTLIQAAA